MRYLTTLLKILQLKYMWIIKDCRVSLWPYFYCLNLDTSDYLFQWESEKLIDLCIVKNNILHKMIPLKKNGMSSIQPFV